MPAPLCAMCLAPRAPRELGSLACAHTHPPTTSHPAVGLEHYTSGSDGITFDLRVYDAYK